MKNVAANAMPVGLMSADLSKTKVKQQLPSEILDTYNKY
jgi:hypothetical protein